MIDAYKRMPQFRNMSGSWVYASIITGVDKSDKECIKIHALDYRNKPIIYLVTPEWYKVQKPRPQFMFVAHHSGNEVISQKLFKKWFTSTHKTLKRNTNNVNFGQNNTNNQ